MLAEGPQILISRNAMPTALSSLPLADRSEWGPAMKLLELVNTDPLAQGALVGLAVTLIVSIGIFVFVMTRKNPQKQ